MSGVRAYFLTLDDSLLRMLYLIIIDITIDTMKNGSVIGMAEDRSIFSRQSILRAFSSKKSVRRAIILSRYMEP